jgi:hypothetical protein
MSESVRVTVDAEPREPGLWRTHRAARRRAGGALPRGPEAAITFPRTLDEASRAVGEFRAGGTDLSKRFRTDVSRGSIVDLRDLGDLDRIQWGTGVACASGRESGSRHWRGAESCARPTPGPAAAALATPQIRTIGEFYGDGADPTRDHLLEPGRLLTSVALPRPVAGERAACVRTIGLRPGAMATGRGGGAARRRDDHLRPGRGRWRGARPAAPVRGSTMIAGRRHRGLSDTAHRR